MKFVINLVKTPQGFSLVQNEVQVNKSAPKVSKEKSYSLSKKFAQQNFTIYPYIPNKQTDNHKYILIPAKTQWFNLNTVHQIQKKALPEWFKIKKGILATMSNIKFEKHEELYKKYRNYIIDLGKQKYITPSEARKGLAGDVCAIIRIHNFLQKWGLINYIHTKPTRNTAKQQTKKPQSKQSQLNKRKECFDKDKLLVSRSYGKDDLQLLKKITKKFRPSCHFCEGICGVVWYEFTDKLGHKNNAQAEGKQEKKFETEHNTMNYSLILCASCFNEGNVPIVVSFEDFSKKTVVDSLGEEVHNENQKKKANQQNKVAEAIQKNKFKIGKTAEQLKMTKENVFRILMTMPIQKIEKISRIQAQTDDQFDQRAQKQQNKNKKNKAAQNLLQVKNLVLQEQSLETKIKREVLNLQNQERELTQTFFQSWLLKINAKLERLKQWENGVETKFKGIERLEKNMLAQRIQALASSLDK